MRLNDWTPEVVHQIRYLNAAPGGGSPRADVLDVVTVPCDGLGELAALVIAGDLQFRENSHSQTPTRPIGEVLAEELLVLCELGVLPPSAAVGVVLTGDLYCDPALERRGGLGDVTSVWQAFAHDFAFVTGVLGNHDLVEVGELDGAVAPGPLDLAVVEVGGLCVGGISGIVGSPQRPNRREEGEFLTAVSMLLENKRRPDLLVLHEAPAVPEANVKGGVALREMLELKAGLGQLVACGHVHWDSPLLRLRKGAQVLNADARCIVLTAV